MSHRPVSRALLRAFQEQSTGTVSVSAGGRTSSLSVEGGAVVGAALHAGHQTAVQGLLRQGQLTLKTLDALWARGAAAETDEDFLDDAGLTQDAVRLAQVAATLRRLDAVAAEGGEIAFEVGRVEARFRLEGAQVLRALAELTGEGLEEDAVVMDAAQKRAQEALAREINEALRRAGVLPPDEKPSESDAESIAEPAAEDALPVLTAEPEPEPAPPFVPPSIEPVIILEAAPEAAAAPVPAVVVPVVVANADEDDSWGALLEGAEPELPPQLVDPVLISPAPVPAPQVIAPPPPPQRTSNPAEEARLRRQRLLLRGMENLGTLPRPSALQGAVAVDPAGQGDASASLPETATADEIGLARLIEAKHATLGGKRDFFAVLEVARDANRDAVKAAFLAQAKLFHPDRLPAGLKHLSAKMAAVFDAIREAYEWLYDDARRRDYLLTLEAEQPSQAAIEAKGAGRAAEEFRKGELLLRKREFVAAEDAFARAYQLDGKAEYLAARGWAIYMDPTRRSDVPRAKQLMVDALKVNPGCDRAHYQLGVIARVEGDQPAAERHFREAVRANPRHLEANQELRLIELRKRRDPPKKGLFK